MLQASILGNSGPLRCRLMGAEACPGLSGQAPGKKTRTRKQEAEGAVSWEDPKGELRVAWQLE